MPRTRDAVDRDAVTPARFSQGMTFEQYVAYAGSPENLAREAGWWLGPVPQDLSGILRDWHALAHLNPWQAEAIRWLAAQPSGPARILVISEDWSSDCRRDVPMLARLAEAGGLELRIFPRDGATLGRGPRADAADSPNADLVNLFLNEKDGRTYQSVPVAAFYTRDFRYLCHYVETPAVYRKEGIVAAMQTPRPGESAEQVWPRFMEDWRALQSSAFPKMWASAAIDEMLAALHELALGAAPVGRTAP